MATTVRSELLQEENRLWRSQPMTPISERGGGCGPADAGVPGAASAVRSRCMSLPLDQRHARVEPVHEQRGQQAEAEVDEHGDEDNLDRLARLVQHGAGEHVDE